LSTRHAHQAVARGQGSAGRAATGGTPSSPLEDLLAITLQPRQGRSGLLVEDAAKQVCNDVGRHLCGIACVPTLTELRKDNYAKLLNAVQAFSAAQRSAMCKHLMVLKGGLEEAGQSLQQLKDIAAAARIVLTSG
jgi:hypothetical protein